MNFLLENPKKRQMVLLSALGVAAFIGLVFVYRAYFPAASSESAETAGSKKLSETAVRKAEKDITMLKEELANNFYGTLKKYNWTPDTTAPGKANPFVQ